MRVGISRERREGRAAGRGDSRDGAAAGGPGLEVEVESGAGMEAGYGDDAYAEAGA